MSRRVVIVGGGIVGAAIAAGLTREAGVEVTVIERGPEDEILGSTGHAPGFVSMLSESPVLSAMAIASARLYEGLDLPGAFKRIGGMEVARSGSSLSNLERRCRLAADLGVKAFTLDPAEAVAHAPELVDPETCFGGVFYPEDGVARADVITRALRAQAAGREARFSYQMSVSGIESRAGRVDAVHTSSGDRFPADEVVVAVGIWGHQVAALAGVEVPLTPVGHPYAYGPRRRLDASAPSPFVRWREETAYARHHGDRLGIGTHDHASLMVDVERVIQAEQPWPHDVFEPALEAALQLLPSEHRCVVDQRLNGVFSMTADNLPLLGRADTVEGLWIAESLWVTHAGGAAEALVELMMERTPQIAGLEALSPGRFAGQDADQLKARALKKYREIWMPVGVPG